MESPSGPNVSGLKRKLTECYGDFPLKVSRASKEHDPSTCTCTCNCRARPTIADSCFNYLNSGLPKHIMFRDHDEWVEFSEPVFNTLIGGFREEKSSVVFSHNGQPLLFDFLSMVLINLRTRTQRSIAWIDTARKYFFPTTAFDDDEDSTDWLSGIARGPLQRSEARKPSSSPPEIVKRVVVEGGAPLPLRPTSPPNILRSKIEKLENDSADFLFVQNMFLSGMGPFASPQNIQQIHQVVQKDNSAKMRRETFDKQIISTREERGDANVRYAWFGSKKADIIGVLLHGFGMAGKPTEGATFGTGIYLTPKNRAFASVNLCDNDDKELMYILLCRVILGNSEQVKPGSNQDLPSSGEFDSGVDNLLEPKCFIVWPTHINSYVHPEYVVSFTLSPKVRGYLSGLKDIRFHAPVPKIGHTFSAFRPVRNEEVEAPVSPWVPFTTLFEAIQDSVSPLAMELLFYHNEELKRKIISREELVNKIRLIVGDQLLVSTLKKLQRSPASWYDSSSLQKQKLDDCASQITEPNGSSSVRVLKADGSAAQAFDLNNSATVATELNLSTAVLKEYSDTSKGDSASPTTDNSVASS